MMTLKNRSTKISTKIERKKSQLEYKRILDLPALLKKNSFFLFGPRGTGKSYWINKSFPDALIFNLLDDEVFDQLMRRPKIIEESVEDWSEIIVIDEIQKLPKLLDEVHRLIEKYGARFLLTGSSARKLKRGGANLLAGRAWESHFFPLTFYELGDDFDLVRFINFGGLPRVYTSPDPHEELRAYIRVYLNEEIKAEALVRSYERFVRFLETIALSNGEEINYQAISSDAGVPPRTLEGYLEVLIDTLLGYLIFPYSKTKKRKAVTRSKFFFFDLGIVNALKGIQNLTPGNVDFGHSFEHFMMNEVYAYNHYFRREQKLCYWRTGNFEVDLIIAPEFGEPTHKKPLVVIEIKSAEKIKDSFFEGIRAFQQEDIPAQCYLVSRSRTEGVKDGIHYLYYGNFLQKLWSQEVF